MLDKFWIEFEKNISGDNIPRLFNLIKTYYDSKSNIGNNDKYFSLSDNFEEESHYSLFKDIFNPLIEQIRGKVSWFTVFFYDEIHRNHDFVIYFPDSHFKISSFKDLYDLANKEEFYSELDNSSSLLFKESKAGSKVEKKILSFSYNNTIVLNDFNNLAYDPVKIISIRDQDKDVKSILQLISASDEIYNKNESNNSLEYLDNSNFYKQFGVLSKERSKKIFRYFYWLNLLRNEVDYKNYYYFPASLLSRRSVGGIVIATKENLTQEDLILCQISSNRVFSLLSNQALGDYSRQAVNYATKSAIAAIMSRNMSHNLGSHILFYLKTIFSDTPNLLQKYLHELEESNGNFTLKVLKELYGKIEILESSADKINAPFLTGVGRFLSYLQERQDFIATIASDFIPYFGSVSFKDFIYDEINPDLRIIRHGASDSYKVKNILLDFIAKSEKFNREDVVVYFKGFDGNDKNNVDLKYLRTINVDLPGGILGRQAFFSIFENFIRNSAKHADKRKIQKLSIVIDIEKPNDNADLYRVKLYDKNRNAQNTIDFINEAITESYIDDTGKLNPSNKGIKEMRISAAWLRGLNVAEIDENNIDPQILKVFKVDDLGEIVVDEKVEGNLCYEFYLPISKKWVFVTNDVPSLDNKIFSKEQLKVKSYEQFIKEDTNYKLILYDMSLNSEQANKIKNISPTRCISISRNDLAKDENDFFNIYKENWFRNIFKEFELDSKFFVIVDDNVEAKFKDKTILDHIIIKGADEEIIKEIENLGTRLIVFRKHNDTREQFNELKETDLLRLYRRTSFLEGISGHNSTNRLLRNENLDNEWLLKMTESALTKILIIDERIYNILTGEKSSFINFSINDIIDHTDSIDKLKKFFTETNIPMDSAIVKLLFNNLCNTIAHKNIINAREYNLMIKERSQSLLGTIEKSLSDNASKSEKGKFNKELYYKKNISIHNIEKNIYSGFFDIKDVDGETIGGVKKMNNEKKLYWEVNNEKYDFVVIHQTILDKLYEFANAESEGDKQVVFNQFTNKFEARFKYIIHSGRSKPEYLPQEVAFNQFSSIEVALFDCKYSLTEQLYAARYE